jgi:hypothetical protein
VYQLLEVATMNKPRLVLVDTTFDITFEAMRDNDMARHEQKCGACGGDCNQLLTEGEVEAFLAGLDGLLVDEVSDADILSVG